MNGKINNYKLCSCSGFCYFLAEFLIWLGLLVMCLIQARPSFPHRGITIKMMV